MNWKVKGNDQLKKKWKLLCNRICYTHYYKLFTFYWVKIILPGKKKECHSLDHWCKAIRKKDCENKPSEKVKYVDGKLAKNLKIGFYCHRCTVVETPWGFWATSFRGYFGLWENMGFLSNFRVLLHLYDQVFWSKKLGGVWGVPFEHLQILTVFFSNT